MSLRKFDVQAKLSLAASLAGGTGSAASATPVGKNVPSISSQWQIEVACRIARFPQR